MRMIKRLSSRKGESFTELLCSVLVMSLATALLAAAIGSAAHVNATAKEQQTELYDQLMAAETSSGEAHDGSITVSVNGSERTPIPISIFGTEDELSAYYPKAVTP